MTIIYGCDSLGSTYSWDAHEEMVSVEVAHAVRLRRLPKWLIFKL